MKAYWGSGCINVRFLGLGTSWRWVFSFTLRPLYLRLTWLGAPQSQCGRHWENSWPYRDSNPDPLDHPASSQSLSRLPVFHYIYTEIRIYILYHQTENVNILSKNIGDGAPSSVHKSPPLVPILSHINPIHINSSYLYTIRFNTVHPPTSWSS
jgi:hypothetical protein